MRLGIVGSEAAKFTSGTEAKAKQEIRNVIALHKAKTIISGGCHLGGIDIWAEEIGRELGLEVIVHKPAVLSWEAGYKPRNLAIAKDSDLVLCISLKKLPISYKGMRFEACYHCRDRNPPHVKSGGCWTAWTAKRRAFVFIEEDPCQ